MNNEPVIDVLNELLAAESASLLPRLGESEIFISWASADDVDDVQCMLAEDREHQSWLVDAILNAGGEPLPALADINSTNLHFLELGFVLPRVFEDRRTLSGYYESASSVVASHPAASEIVGRIAGRIRKHVEKLEKLTSRLTANKS